MRRFRCFMRWRASFAATAMSQGFEAGRDRGMSPASARRSATRPGRPRGRGRCRRRRRSRRGSRSPTLRASPEWRNGIRSRLKIGRPQGHEGSTPSSGTTSQAPEDPPVTSPDARSTTRRTACSRSSTTRPRRRPRWPSSAPAGSRRSDLEILRGEAGADRMDGTGDVSGADRPHPARRSRSR